MRAILLFGPPGIGKSTVIKYFKDNKGCFNRYVALDLEEIKTRKGIDLTELRLLEMQRLFSKCQDYGNTTLTLVVGAAALDPKVDYGRHTTKILLVADQVAYEQRRYARDQGQPGKSKQSQHLISDWRKGVKYDVVIDTTNLSVLETVRAICRTKH